MIVITAIVAVALAYSIWMSNPPKYDPPLLNGTVEYIDLGCDDTNLEEIQQDDSIMKVCKGIGDICRLACFDSTAPEVQAHMGKGNSVTCRCFRT